MSKLCPFRRYDSTIDFSNGDWYWIDRETYGGPGGCVADGATDNTTALKAVLTAAANAGKYVYVPPAEQVYVVGVLTGAGFPAKVYGAPSFDNPRCTVWTSKLKLKDAASATMWYMSAASGMDIRYLDADGNAANQDPEIEPNAFYLHNASNITFRSCYIHDFGLSTQGGLGVAGDGSSRVGVYGCTFARNANDVEPMAGCTYWTADNNYCHDSIAEGMVCFSSGAACHSHSILNNNIVGGAYGVSINNSYGNTVRGNTITNSKYGINLKNAACNDNMIDGNTIVSGAASTGAGIHVESSCGGSNTISDNHIDGWTNANGAMRIQAAGQTFSGNEITDSNSVMIFSPCTFSQNQISGSTSHGIYFRAATDGTVLNGNTITGSAKRGVNGAEYAQSNITVNDNIITGNTEAGVAFAAGSSGSYSGNTLSDNGPGDTWDGLTDGDA